jgi:trypsin
MFRMNVLLVMIFSSDAAPSWRILAGSKAKLGEYASLLLLTRKGHETYCSAFIVSSQQFLTAGHCVCNSGNNSSNEFVVHAATVDRLADPGEEYNVSKIDIHPTYSKDECHKMSHGTNKPVGTDIAIGTVDKPFKMSKNVGISKLSKDDGRNQWVTLVGFGKDPADNTSKVLKCARVRTQQRCSSDSKPHSLGLDVSMICVDTETQIQAAKSGDSGAPMLDRAGNVLGLYSGGYFESDHSYMAYIRMSNALMFIKQYLVEQPSMETIETYLSEYREPASDDASIHSPNLIFYVLLITLYFRLNCLL